MGDTTSTVYLNLKTCSCRIWDISSIPYKHVMSAIYCNRERPEAYVDDVYSKKTFLAVYDHVFNSIPSKHEWKRTDLPDIEPNIVRNPIGRPKKRESKV